MKKIGILTLPFNNNYGGYLQAFALLTVLKENGFSPEILYRQFAKPDLLSLTKHFITTLIKIIKGEPHRCLINTPDNELRRKGANNTSFLNTMLTPRTKPLYSTRTMKNEVRKRKYQCIIVGSDQVWRPDYVPDIADYFLGFLPDSSNIKRVSYAASFGNSSPCFSNEERSHCGNLLKLFDAVSLRESSGIDVLKQMDWTISQSPIVTLDPTMLLTIEDYVNLFSLKSSAGNEIVCYVLDNNYNTKALIDTASKKTDCPISHIIDPQRWKNFDYIMPSIVNWLESIYNARFVITDSFHGTVFAILFNKPFVVIANSERGSDRFDTLLSTFGLDSRMVKDEQGLDRALTSEINWNNVNSNLNEMRDKSLEYLLKSIS